MNKLPEGWTATATTEGRAYSPYRKYSREVITAAMKAQGLSHYHMELVGEDATALHKAVNVGIDSHLEACFVPSRGDSYVGVRGTPTRAGHLACVVSAESLPTLLRRLTECGDRGINLADTIVETLGINDVGEYVGRD